MKNHINDPGPAWEDLKRQLKTPGLRRRNSRKQYGDKIRKTSSYGFTRHSHNKNKTSIPYATQKIYAKRCDSIQTHDDDDNSILYIKWLNKGFFSRLGERGSGSRVKGDIQDYHKIRDECIGNGVLWKDPEFPANNSSLFYSQSHDKHFEWKRPKDIVLNPQFFVEGFSCFDIRQGKLSSSCLIPALTNLSLYRNLFFHVVPFEQSFTDFYTGVFHFRFWKFGRWLDVVVDDRLPTNRGQLIYMRSTEVNVFWGALLEKAYAKLHGSYEALKRGSTCEAIEDFTGGVTEIYDLSSCPYNLFTMLLKAHERSSLMSCEVDTTDMDSETPEGLIRGLSYSITCVKYFEIDTQIIKGSFSLLRLRNPWGNETKWNGAWSDQSPEWQYIFDAMKEDIGLTVNDGEFWMSCKDFQTYFNHLQICNLSPDSLPVNELREKNKKRWEMSYFEGEWVRGVTAGGCRNFIDTFWYNPQYRITLTDIDENEDDEKCTVIIALMQKNRRYQRQMEDNYLSIGFVVYHLAHPDYVTKPLDINFFRYNKCIAQSPSFINLREVSCRFKLSPGTYYIVPSTFDPNEEAEFLLRVFSEHQNYMEEYDEEIGLIDSDQKSCCDMKEVLSEEQLERDKGRQLFEKFAGENMEINWMELKEILDQSMESETNEGISKDVCRSMVAMMDTDFTGKLGFEEFKLLWDNIKNWKNIYKLFDTAGTNQLITYDLRKTLNAAGYKVNNHILNMLVHRYGTTDGFITIDDFIMCAVRLKTMIDLFRYKTRDNVDKVIFNLEEWLQSTVYS